nr:MULTISPECIES: hypothetical protein [unclassified Clostridium]
MLHYELEKKKGSSLYEELYQKLKEDILRGGSCRGPSCLPKGSWPGIMASA